MSGENQAGEVYFNKRDGNGKRPGGDKDSLLV